MFFFSASSLRGLHKPHVKLQSAKTALAQKSPVKMLWYYVRRGACGVEEFRDQSNRSITVSIEISKTPAEIRRTTRATWPTRPFYVTCLPPETETLLLGNPHLLPLWECALKCNLERRLRKKCHNLPCWWGAGGWESLASCFSLLRSVSLLSFL